MKKNIHPQYGPATVVCSCGNTFETKSTLSDIKIELCSACHPFFTGKQKIIDTAGRVEKFKKRMEKKQENIISKKVKRKEKKESKEIIVKAEKEESKSKTNPTKTKKKKNKK